MVVFAITLVGLLVDAIAVSLGRVPLAGLPLLALYTIPVAVLPEGVPFLAFIAGGAAYVAMLMADERDRLAHWGRLVSRQVNPSDPTRDRHIGFERHRAPGISDRACHRRGPAGVPPGTAGLDSGWQRRGGGGGGGSTLSFSDPMVSLAKSLRRAKIRST